MTTNYSQLLYFSPPPFNKVLATKKTSDVILFTLDIFRVDHLEGKQPLSTMTTQHISMLQEWVEWPLGGGFCYLWRLGEGSGRKSDLYFVVTVV